MATSEDSAVGQSLGIGEPGVSDNAVQPAVHAENLAVEQTVSDSAPPAAASDAQKSTDGQPAAAIDPANQLHAPDPGAEDPAAVSQPAELKEPAANAAAVEPEVSLAKMQNQSLTIHIENCVRIVKGEIHNVLSLMRLNRRYSFGARFEREIPATAESPLVRGLKALHETLNNVQDLQDMDTLMWLRPFLDVVESGETSGPITGGALSSLSKFLLYGFIHPGSPRAAESVCRICRVVTRCRFERTDHSGDEVVLVRILQVLLDCLRCPAGFLLSDQNVWDMVQTCYDIKRQPRSSELLQRTAEHILMQVTLTVFARFSQLQAEGHFSQDFEGPVNLHTSLENDDSMDGDTVNEAPDTTDAAPPYGMPCMYKVLEFLCHLTNPGDGVDAVTAENSKLLGLALVNVVLETGGKQLALCPALVSVIQHDLSRNLLQNSRTNNLQILSQTLRVVFNMFNSVREHMKVQLEVFFNSIHLAESSWHEAREMALESLVEFCREPQLMTDIYTNYDCDVKCTNLFEDMCKFLSKNTFPLSGSLNALNLLSLEGLLAIVRSLADSCDSARSILQHADSELDEEAHKSKTVEQLRAEKQRKKQIAMGSEQFNRNPKKGIDFCQSLGLLPEVLEPTVVAEFLRKTPGLDRTAIGTYLGEPDDMALAVLAAFVKSFEFADMEISEALRNFLADFRLPGESQKIARIVEQFAGHYFDQCPGPLANPDTAYVLSYAIIMLNTDLHNHQVRKKMQKEDFIRMNRGINDNADLPPEFLSKIYDNIATNEIKMSEDLSDVTAGGNQSNAAPRWDDLLANMRHRYGSHFTASTQAGFVPARDMFLVVWDRIVAALSVVFETTEDDKVMKKTLEGFHNFSKICSFHQLHDEFNKLISTLAKSLQKFAEAAVALGPPDEESQWILVNNAKVKLAAQMMFAVACDHSECLRDGWRPILDYVAKLYHLQALPTSMMERDDFVDLDGKPLISSHGTMLPNDEGAGGVGSLFHFLWGSATKQQNAEVKSTSRLGLAGYEELTAWVASLRLEELLTGTKLLSDDSFAALVSALVLSSSRLMEMQESGNHGNGGVMEDVRPVDTVLFHLELMTNIAVANCKRLGAAWPTISGHFQRLLQQAQSPGPVVERAVVNHLRLCIRLMSSSTSEETTITTDLMDGLRSITLLPAPVMQSLSERVSVGILMLVRANAGHIRNREDWKTILNQLQEFVEMAPSTSRPALEALSYLLREDGQQHVTALNFDFFQQTLLASLDAVLSESVAKVHVAQAIKVNNPTSADVRKWQQQNGAQIMALMHALFVRLSAWKGVQKNKVARVYHPSRGHVGRYQTLGDTGGNGNSNPNADSSDGTQAPAGIAEQNDAASSPNPVDQDMFGLGESEDSVQNWCTLWMLSIKAFCRIAHDSRYSPVTGAAMECLERSLLCSDVPVPFASAWRDCYDQILFPIVSSKFKAAASSGQPPAEALCLHTLLILCKSFRNNLDVIIHLSELHMLWLRLLGLIEAFKQRIKAPKRDPVSQEIVEVLKEMLQVIHTDKLFQQVQQSSGQDMWNLTATVIDAFCPELKPELMPTEGGKVLTPTAIESESQATPPAVPPEQTQSAPPQSQEQVVDKESNSPVQ